MSEEIENAILRKLLISVNAYSIGVSKEYVLIGFPEDKIDKIDIALDNLTRLGNIQKTNDGKYRLSDESLDDSESRAG